jgi:hypothetical protein
MKWQDNAEFHNLYSSWSIIRIIKSRRLSQQCTWCDGEEEVYRLLVQKPEGKRSVGRQRCRKVDSIKVDLVEVGWGGMDWLGIGMSGEFL